MEEFWDYYGPHRCVGPARVEIARAMLASNKDLEMCTLDIVKNQYKQSCTQRLCLVNNLKKDVDDASDEDYQLWQVEEIEGLSAVTNHGEISRAAAVRCIHEATLEHAYANSWASTRALPLHVTVGALVHHAFSKAGLETHNESTNRKN